MCGWFCQGRGMTRLVVLPETICRMGIRVVEDPVPSFEPVEFGGYTCPELPVVCDGTLVYLLVGFYRYKCPLVLWNDLFVEWERPVYGHMSMEGCLILIEVLEEWTGVLI